MLEVGSGTQTRSQCSPFPGSPPNTQHLVPVSGWSDELLGGFQYPQEADLGPWGFPNPPLLMWSHRGGEKGFGSALRDGDPLPCP